MNRRDLDTRNQRHSETSGDGGGWLHACHRVVVGHAHRPDTGVPGSGDQFLGRAAAIGRGGMEMQVNHGLRTSKIRTLSIPRVVPPKVAVAVDFVPESAPLRGVYWLPVCLKDVRSKHGPKRRPPPLPAGVSLAMARSHADRSALIVHG